jgi:hypothetical protein
MRCIYVEERTDTFLVAIWLHESELALTFQFWCDTGWEAHSVDTMRPLNRQPGILSEALVACISLEGSVYISRDDISCMELAEVLLQAS